MSKLWDYMDGVKNDMMKEEKGAAAGAEAVADATPAEEIKVVDAKSVEKSKKGLCV